MPNGKRTPGRKQSKEFASIQSKVRKLKSTVNPKTGRPYSFREIGKKLGMTAPAAQYYISGDRNCCPVCRRPYPKKKR